MSRLHSNVLDILFGASIVNKPRNKRSRPISVEKLMQLYDANALDHYDYLNRRPILNDSDKGKVILLIVNEGRRAGCAKIHSGLFHLQDLAWSPQEYAKLLKRFTGRLILQEWFRRMTYKYGQEGRFGLNQFVFSTELLHDFPCPVDGIWMFHYDEE